MSEPSRVDLLDRKVFRPDPEDEDEIRAGLADVEAGRSVVLTEAELVEWEATGTLPDSVQARFVALGCSDSPG